MSTLAQHVEPVFEAESDNVRVNLITYSLVQCALSTWRSATPRRLEFMLRVVAEIALDQVDESALSPTQAAHVRFLREYFAHYGDWRIMRECLSEQLACEGISERLIRETGERMSDGLHCALRAAIHDLEQADRQE